MTTQYTKALIVVHREESADDFREIAIRIKKLDPAICGAMAPGYISEEMLPPHFLALPLLVVYLVNPPASNADQGVIRNATHIAVESINKIEEYEHFKKHNIPCLPIIRFQWGMELDQEIYGDWVVLKPENIQSTGQDVNMVPTKLIPTLKLSDFPKDHLMHRDSYLVQKLVKTGENPNTYRATVFMGAILSSGFARMVYPYPVESSELSTLLSTTVATNFLSQRTRHFVKDLEANDLALKVAEAFPNNPLLAIDILRDGDTNKLYVLETNLGGNTWHFSSALSRNYPGYDDATRKATLLQYGAWDVAAQALVKKTHELAV